MPSDSSLDELERKKHKKEKHKKKNKKKDKKKHKKHHKSKKKRHHSDSSNSSAGSDGMNIDVKKDLSLTDPEAKRDDWMTSGNFLLPTFSKEEPKKQTVTEKNKYEIYDPKTSVRELNPYWKTGEGGLPSFQKPADDDDNNYSYKEKSTFSKSEPTRNWMKNKPTKEVPRYEKKRSHSSSSEENSRSVSPQPKPTEISQTSDLSHKNFLTDQEMNAIGAKLIKAELMGNKALAEELKIKLEKAKEYKKLNKNKPNLQKEENVVLSLTNAAGTSRPINQSSEPDKRRHDKKNKKKRVETHVGGERTKYYADDDRFDIKTMFENEKFVDSRDQDIEFAKSISKLKNNDDLVDVFSDTIRKDKKGQGDEKEEAIREHNKMQKVLDACEKCFDSAKMEKDLVVYVGDKVYLSIPWHEGLVKDHLIICPVQHIACSTQLDEDVWEEISNIRKSIVQYYTKQSKDVIFFEIAKHLHRRPHMQIHCIANNELEMAQFYFKKAILESDVEWAMNKKLIDLKMNKNDVRRSIPKGLSYFWVNFGMDSGMAHVIEDQDQFPTHFAQEIIGGILNLDVNKWRKPRKDNKPYHKVRYFESLSKIISGK